jgi:hypothetical protein
MSFRSAFVTPHPEALLAAVGDLHSIGAAKAAADVAAAVASGGVVAAVADEVSALTAAQFAAHAGRYRAISAQAAAIHELFLNTLGTSARSYASTEAANTVAAS